MYLIYSSNSKFKRTLNDMEKNWPFFNSTMDILDMVISKADPEISKIYENNLADNKLKRVGEKLRFQFQLHVNFNRISRSKNQFQFAYAFNSISKQYVLNYNLFQFFFQYFFLVLIHNTILKDKLNKKN